MSALAVVVVGLAVVVVGFPVVVVGLAVVVVVGLEVVVGCAVIVGCTVVAGAAVVVEDWSRLVSVACEEEVDSPAATDDDCVVDGRDGRVRWVGGVRLTEVDEDSDEAGGPVTETELAVVWSPPQALRASIASMTMPASTITHAPRLLQPNLIARPPLVASASTSSGEHR